MRPYFAVCPAIGTASRCDHGTRRRQATPIFSRNARVHFFWVSFDTFQAVREKCKIATETKSPKPKNDFKPHKAVVLAKREIPWEPTRHLHTRAFPAARPGFGRKGTAPALSARGRAVRAKARLANGLARPRVPGIREIRRVADFPSANRCLPRGVATP